MNSVGVADGEDEIEHNHSKSNDNAFVNVKRSRVANVVAQQFGKITQRECAKSRRDGNQWVPVTNYTPKRPNPFDST